MPVPIRFLCLWEGDPSSISPKLSSRTITPAHASGAAGVSLQGRHPACGTHKNPKISGGTMAELMGSQEKNFFAGLVDFGFRQQQVRRLVKILYVIAVLGGFVAVVAQVVLGFQQTQSQGLVALVAGIAAFFVWVLLTRLLLELALIMVRTAEGIERATHPGN